MRGAGFVVTYIQVRNQATDHVRVILWQVDTLFLALLVEVSACRSFGVTTKSCFSYFANREAHVLFEEVASRAHYDLVNVEDEGFAGDF